MDTHQTVLSVGYLNVISKLPIAGPDAAPRSDQTLLCGFWTFSDFPRCYVKSIFGNEIRGLNAIHFSFRNVAVSSCCAVGHGVFRLRVVLSFGSRSSPSAAERFAKLGEAWRNKLSVKAALRTQSSYDSVFILKADHCSMRFTIVSPNETYHMIAEFVIPTIFFYFFFLHLWSRNFAI